MFYEDYLKKMDSCPFCNLEEKEVLKENESASLILAKAPYTKDHLLVIPKKHALSLEHYSEKEKEDIDKLINFARKSIRKKYHNVSILYREGDKKIVGKSIDHIHTHIIPNMMIGAVDINAHKRKILSEENYLKLIEEARKLL